MHTSYNISFYLMTRIFPLLLFIGLACGQPLISNYENMISPIPTRKDSENIESMLGKTLRLKHFVVWFN